MYHEATKSMYIYNDNDMEYYLDLILNKQHIRSLVFTEEYNNTFIPENINVDVLRIHAKSITELPKKLFCNKLRLYRSPIQEIPEMNVIRTELTANRMINDLVLPDNMNLNFVDFHNSNNISTIPKNLKVNRYLDIYNTNIKHIPDGTYIGSKILYNNPSNPNNVLVSYIEGFAFNTTHTQDFNTLSILTCL